MHADIFCRVIDNFGDIGVCWRLARRMSEGYQWTIRLWVDNLHAFARIQPGILPDKNNQVFNNIEIVHWTDHACDQEPGDVVIEAFACDPPERFVQAMYNRLGSKQSPPVWINLEYLSAESWVENCHRVPSQRADGLIKYFFFPGFTPETGGLLREPELIAERDMMQRSRLMQESFLQTLGMTTQALAHWQAGARLISLFCYPYAPIASLAEALVHSNSPSVLLVPDGIAPTLESELSRREAQNNTLDTNIPYVQVVRLPFVSQPEYDKILWCSDLNFVRGEDSFVRAAWAARPLVWQIYAQEENAHLEKLESWLVRYPVSTEAKALIRAWNQVPQETSSSLQKGGSPCPTMTSTLSTILQEDRWKKWQHDAANWAMTEASKPDLGSQLAEFCAELLKKR